ncbi:hypothetical protein V8E51_008271 [Hyaloscypha variabilis]
MNYNKELVYLYDRDLSSARSGHRHVIYVTSMQERQNPTRYSSRTYAFHRGADFRGGTGAEADTGTSGSREGFTGEVIGGEETGDVVRGTGEVESGGYLHGLLSDEDFTALEEAWKGVPRVEGPLGLIEIRAALYKKREYRESEGWKGKGDEEEGEDLDGESFTDGQDSWGGFTGERGGSTGVDEAWEEESEVWEEVTGERESSTGPQDSWKDLAGGSTGPQESRESSLSPADSPQEQYCSSYNPKKPLPDFGRFLTCNACRERNRRVKEARRTRPKATYIAPKATGEEIERSI